MIPQPEMAATSDIVVNIPVPIVVPMPKETMAHKPILRSKFVAKITL